MSRSFQRMFILALVAATATAKDADPKSKTDKLICRASRLFHHRRTTIGE